MIDQAEPVYSVPIENRIARNLLKPIFQGLFHVLARIKVTGRENVPLGKPYLVAFNHISTFDPPFVLAFWPEMLEGMGAVDLWSRPGQAQLVRMYHAIPVHRGEYDRVLFDKALGVLAAGKPLLLAPEGGRSHNEGMRRARPGVAFIVEKAQVPVVPVGITGTTDDFFKQAIKAERRQLELRIGKPFQLPPVAGKGDERREARQHNADLVMAHIAGLLPEVYRGFYAGMVIEPE
ncbi:MAG TPA: lysophospholipid acyltransferase family protein [Anaerolineales bacterium]|jgi:1-acyl-sn-glycerol-3-phosphate acyltransferase